MLRAALLTAAACVALAGCQTMKPSYWGALANPDPLTLSDVPSDLTGRELAAALIAKSDVRCEDYLVGVTVQRNGGNSAFSIIGNGLGTIGGLVSKVQAANAFSAAGAFATTTGRTLDETVFNRNEFSVIYEAVKRGRNAERKALLENLSQFERLGRQEILARVNAYDLNCGITYGLVELRRALQAAPERAAELGVAPDLRQSQQPPSQELMRE